MDDLLHPVDVAKALVVPGTVTSHVVGRAGDGAWGISACTGETRMPDVVGPKAHLYHGQFTGRVGQDRRKVTVEQHVADQPTVAQTRGKYRRLVRMVKACQHEPATHWRYGRAHHVTTPAGIALWMLIVSGDGHPSGGVLVARSGRHLSVVETWCNSGWWEHKTRRALGAEIEKLTIRTLHRLR